MINIGIFTSSRSDFGILKKIAIKIEKNKKYRLKIIATGSHLSKYFGHTINEIKKNRFSNIICLKNLILKNGEIDILESNKKLIKGIYDHLENINIDYMIMLGDRYELLPISTYCFLKKIKIIHIHGGEVTLGAIDNKIRNMVSMLSDYHFVATKKSKIKLEKFDIDKKTIFCIGAPGIEGINKNLYEKNFLEKKFNFRFSKKNIMISIHPETLSKKSIEYLEVLLDSLKEFPLVKFIFTSPAADHEGYLMKKRIIKFVKRNKNCLFFDSLGHKDYLSFVNICNLVVGNSSSGIIEIPSLNKISINLGKRQLGRERSDSVKNVDFKKTLIVKEIKKYLNKKNTVKFKNPYELFNKPSAKFLEIIQKCL